MLDQVKGIGGDHFGPTGYLEQDTQEGNEAS